MDMAENQSGYDRGKRNRMEECPGGFFGSLLHGTKTALSLFKTAGTYITKKLWGTTETEHEVEDYQYEEFERKRKPVYQGGSFGQKRRKGFVECPPTHLQEVVTSPAVSRPEENIFQIPWKTATQKEALERRSQQLIARRSSGLLNDKSSSFSILPSSGNRFQPYARRTPSFSNGWVSPRKKDPRESANWCFDQSTLSSGDLTDHLNEVPVGMIGFSDVSFENNDSVGDCSSASKELAALSSLGTAEDLVPVVVSVEVISVLENNLKNQPELPVVQNGYDIPREIPEPVQGVVGDPIGTIGELSDVMVAKPASVAHHHQRHRQPINMDVLFTVRAEMQQEEMEIISRNGQKEKTADAQEKPTSEMPLMEEKEEMAEASRVRNEYNGEENEVLEAEAQSESADFPSWSMEENHNQTGESLEDDEAEWTTDYEEDDLGGFDVGSEQVAEVEVVRPVVTKNAPRRRDTPFLITIPQSDVANEEVRTVHGTDEEEIDADGEDYEDEQDEQSDDEYSDEEYEDEDAVAGDQGAMDEENGVEEEGDEIICDGVYRLDAENEGSSVSSGEEDVEDVDDVNEEASVEEEE